MSLILHYNTLQLLGEEGKNCQKQLTVNFGQAISDEMRKMGPEEGTLERERERDREMDEC